jgi:hypothetical protein
MGFEDTNFIDDLGHKMGKDHPILGCLGIILAGGLLLAAGYGAIYLLSIYTKAFNLTPTVFNDGDKKITFDLPAGWISFDREKNNESYYLTRMFRNEQNSGAVLETVSYKSVKYTKKKMQKDTAEIAKQVRSVLKQKEIKHVTAGEKSVRKQVNDIIKEYAKYKRVKCGYRNGYGWACYKSGKNTVYYYFRALKNYMIVMTYDYDDSEKYTPAALEEQAKLVDMWEKAFN